MNKIIIKDFIIRLLSSKTSKAFTIVELLMVIVIIGILAAITLVSYINITKDADESALSSDLENAKKQLAIFQVENGKYPDTINCAVADSSKNKCIKSSSGSTYSYAPNKANNPSTYVLAETKNGINYAVADNYAPKIVNLSQPASCSSGFIPVPGSLTYGVSGFCVMKYEAKQVGLTAVPIGESAGNPWVDISQDTATINSANVAGCSGCHLITEAEWLTIVHKMYLASQVTGVVV